MAMALKVKDDIYEISPTAGNNSLMRDMIAVIIAIFCSNPSVTLSSHL